jgi:GH15 family glucan-1,4-alpha-glucosidase
VKVELSPPRIQDHAIVGDGRSAALVSLTGCVDWLCWPRFDSGSLFASIVDTDRGDEAGRWRIGPASPGRATRRYLGDSPVLVTTFETPGGRLTLTDLMTVGSEAEKRRRLVPEHELLRVVECERGEVEVEIDFVPRPDHGRRRPRLRDAGALGIRLEDRAELYTLRSDVALRIDGEARAAGRLRMRAGERACFSLTYDRGGPAVLVPPGEHAARAIARSAAWWSAWAARCTYQGPHRSQVVRSLLTLKLLSFAPSGAIVAAPTTSLPERIGGDLNWDYRFCWLRDASLTVACFLDLGYAEEAAAFVSWLLHTTRLTRPELRILYDVYGEIPGDEEVLAALSGHRGSRPVRIRNAAADQLQLDAYGEVIDAVARIVRAGARLDRATQALLRDLGRTVLASWRSPDHGIWEGRAEKREHTHSRILCWVALDRLLELSDAGALKGLRADVVRAARAEIRADVEGRAWNAELRSYTQTLGGASLDASLLLASWYGFAGAREPRWRETYRRIVERLGAGKGLLYRYEESLAAGEGAFAMCCFWAVIQLARGAGSLDDAEALLEELVGLGNDVGLFGEEIDPRTGEHLGNFPQAFTHVGLIAAAVAVERRRAAEPSTRPARARPVTREEATS